MKRRNTVDFSLVEFHTRFLFDKKFMRLFDEWIKSDCLKRKKPSIDRINRKKHYSFANIHFLTWEENRYKQRMECRNRSLPVLQIVNDIVINRYKSQREAILKVNASQGNLSMCLNGKRKHCKGFSWKYENPELLETPK
jgi:hypothetical protein